MAAAAAAFKEVEAQVALHVYPSHLADLQRAVADRLSRLLMRYEGATWQRMRAGRRRG